MGEGWKGWERGWPGQRKALIVPSVSPTNHQVLLILSTQCLSSLASASVRTAPPWFRHSRAHPPNPAAAPQPGPVPLQ